MRILGTDGEQERAEVDACDDFIRNSHKFAHSLAPDEHSPMDRGCWRRGPARSDAFTIVAALLDDVGGPTSTQTRCST
jgi:hypothetical protein